MAMHINITLMCQIFRPCAILSCVWKVQFSFNHYWCKLRTELSH